MGEAYSHLRDKLGTATYFADELPELQGPTRALHF